MAIKWRLDNKRIKICRAGLELKRQKPATAQITLMDRRASKEFVENRKLYFIVIL